MGDEGVGVHAVRALDGAALLPVSRCSRAPAGSPAWPPAECDAVVMIDATLDDQAPGTVSVIEPRYASDFRVLGLTNIGLKDLVESAALIESLPQVTLITVSVADLQLDADDAVARHCRRCPRVVRLARELALTLANPAAPAPETT